MSSLATFKKLQPEEYLRQHYEQGLRPDGRKGLNSLRPISISVNSVSTADGSAVVKQGDTVIICGIKLEIATPKDETPDHGYIVPNLSLGPICHSKFRPGPPCDLAQTASQFLLETITNSDIIKPEDLCILRGKYAWCIYADLVCLNYDGNILDTSLKALISALKTMKLPKTKIVEMENDEFNLEVDPEERVAFKLGTKLPTSCTMSIFGDNLLLDPTDEEEEQSEACVTVVLNSDNELCHVHKPGGIGISPEKLQQCISVAKKNSKHMQKLIESASKAMK